MSIFIYTWSFLDVVISERQEAQSKKVLMYYKNISIFVFPLISYALYVCYSVALGNFKYDDFHNKDLKDIAFKKSEIVY